MKFEWRVLSRSSRDFSLPLFGLLVSLFACGCAAPSAAESSYPALLRYCETAPLFFLDEFNLVQVELPNEEVVREVVRASAEDPEVAVRLAAVLLLRVHQADTQIFATSKRLAGNTSPDQNRVVEAFFSLAQPSVASPENSDGLFSSNALRWAQSEESHAWRIGGSERLDRWQELGEAAERFRMWRLGVLLR